MVEEFDVLPFDSMKDCAEDRKMDCSSYRFMNINTYQAQNQIFYEASYCVCIQAMIMVLTGISIFEDFHVHHRRHNTSDIRHGNSLISIQQRLVL